MTTFKVGEYVYYQERGIGRLSDTPDEGHRYRIDYCQGMDLNSGPRGGNGPITSNGYPKKITRNSKASDYLFVKGMALKDEIGKLETILEARRVQFEAVKIARDLTVKPE